MALDLIASTIVERCKELFSDLIGLTEESRIDAVNAIRLALHQHSPFKAEPVDCVLWVPAESIQANAYNPNTVAPPEMKLLERSIKEDGYTQPVVTWLEPTGAREVIDGFHRNLIARTSKAVKKRIRGYIPVVTANADRTDTGDRMASTIRHNRARGKHTVDGMSEIVIDLARRNWSDDKIAKELGMDADEVLRLKQIAGLAEMFADKEFSEAWEVS